MRDSFAAKGSLFRVVSAAREAPGCRQAKDENGLQKNCARVRKKESPIIILRDHYQTHVVPPIRECGYCEGAMVNIY